MDAPVSRLKITPIMRRMILILALPVMGLLTFSIYNLYRSGTDFNTLSNTEGSVSLASDSFEVMNALQVERNAAILWLGDKSNAPKLLENYKKSVAVSNETLSKFVKNLSHLKINRNNEIEDQINRMIEKQKIIQTQSINRIIGVNDAYFRYTNISDSLLDINGQFSALITDPDLFSDVNGYIAFLNLIERQCRNRDYVSIILLNNDFSAPAYGVFSANQAELELFKRDYFNFSRNSYHDEESVFSNQVVNAFNSAQMNQVKQMSEALSKNVELNKPTQNFANFLTVEEWNNTSNQIIIEFSNQIIEISEHISKNATAQMRLNWIIFLINLIFPLIGVILALIFASTTVKDISKTVKTISGLMRKLRRGDYDVDIPARARDDEFAEMIQILESFKAELVAGQTSAKVNVKQQSQIAETSSNLMSASDLFKSLALPMIHKNQDAADFFYNSSDDMSEQANLTKAQALAVAEIAKETSKNVQSVATTAMQLTNAISEIGRNLQQSIAISHQAVQQAQTTSSTMTALYDSSQKNRRCRVAYPRHCLANQFAGFECDN